MESLSIRLGFLMRESPPEESDVIYVLFRSTFYVSVKCILVC